MSAIDSLLFDDETVLWRHEDARGGLRRARAGWFDRISLAAATVLTATLAAGLVLSAVIAESDLLRAALGLFAMAGAALAVAIMVSAVRAAMRERRKLQAMALTPRRFIHHDLDNGVTRSVLRGGLAAVVASPRRGAADVELYVTGQEDPLILHALPDGRAIADLILQTLSETP